MLLLDGTSLAQDIRTKLKARVAQAAHPLTLVVFLVGDDEASHLYVGLKQKACEEVGIVCEVKMYPAEVSEDDLIRDIQVTNERTDVTGILVQLPLPTQSAERVMPTIDPKKDVDGFHAENVRSLEGHRPGLVPPVHLGVLKLLESTKQALRGKKVVLLSKPFFAYPLTLLLKELGLETTVIHPTTHPDWKIQTQQADVVITVLGMPKFLTGECIKTDAILIDVGTTKIDGRVIGDIDRESVASKAFALSPVPGGVGPLTVAYLLLNVVKADVLRV